MGPRLRRWTRPCQASRGDLPLPLGRSPTFWAHVQEDSRKEHSRARPAGSGLDLGGQQTSRVLKGLGCPLFRSNTITQYRHSFVPTCVHLCSNPLIGHGPSHLANIQHLKASTVSLFESDTESTCSQCSQRGKCPAQDGVCDGPKVEEVD